MPDIGGSPSAYDTRDWSLALETNAETFNSSADTQTAGASSHATEFVDAGTTIHLIKVESVIAN